MVQDWRSRIAVVPDVRGGQPVIRGMRLTVKDVFEYLAGGMTVDELLADFPELAREDVEACFAYAAEHRAPAILRSPRTSRGTRRSAVRPSDRIVRRRGGWMTMEQEVELKVRKPVGAVLSVRVPRDLATAADEFARERSMSMSELVRLAVEDYLSFPPPRVRWSLYGSTIDANLVLNSDAARLPDSSRGGTQTKTVEYEEGSPLAL